MCRTSSVASCEDLLSAISRETEPECDGEAAATAATRLTLMSESRRRAGEGGKVLEHRDLERNEGSCSLTCSRRAALSDSPQCFEFGLQYPFQTLDVSITYFSLKVNLHVHSVKS